MCAGVCDDKVSPQADNLESEGLCHVSVGGDGGRPVHMALE